MKKIYQLTLVFVLLMVGAVVASTIGILPAAAEDRIDPASGATMVSPSLAEAITPEADVVSSESQLLIRAADVITAAGCEYTDVIAAVSGAKPGDMVLVPDCAATTWGNNTLTITRGITLKGAGMDKTTIVSEPPSGNDFTILYQPDALALSNDEAFRVIGFTFDANNSTPLGIIGVDTSNDPAKKLTQVVIGDNKFQNFAGISVIRFRGQVYGVAYSNLFDRVTRPFSVYGANEIGWNNKDPLVYGDGNNFFFEDNTITFSSPMSAIGTTETGQGARGVVMRYNTWDNTNSTRNDLYWDQHGLQSMDSGCQQHSTMIGEYYGNIINKEYIVSGGMFWWHNPRGSWLLMFNNLMTGNFVGAYPYIGLQQYSCNECQSGGGSHLERINNNYYWNNVAYGSRRDAELSLDSCRDQYATYGFTQYTTTENVDFWNYNPDCTINDCQTGIGVGASVPTGTCAEGVGYWVTSYSPATSVPATMAEIKLYTQAGRFYKCTDSNTWRPYYQPYTYPHPLRDSKPVVETFTYLPLILK